MRQIPGPSAGYALVRAVDAEHRHFLPAQMLRQAQGAESRIPGVNRPRIVGEAGAAAERPSAYRPPEMRHMRQTRSPVVDALRVGTTEIIRNGQEIVHARAPAPGNIVNPPVRIEREKGVSAREPFNRRIHGDQIDVSGGSEVQKRGRRRTIGDYRDPPNSFRAVVGFHGSKSPSPGRAVPSGNRP